MALNKTAAAYLAYFAYIDDALETVLASDFVTLLAGVPAGAANGPWKLCWGPAVNDGILGYVAQGADGSYALAFRGTDVDGSVSGSIQNVVADANGFFLVPWLYPQQAGAPLQISAGINGALALAIALTDPATSVSLLDYLRGLAKTGALDLMVTGHSLGGALAIVATAWLNDQLPKVEPLKFSVLCINRHHRLTAITISPRVFVLCSRWRGSHVPAFPPVGGGAVAQHRQSHADVRPRRRERFRAPAVANNRRQAGVSGLRLRDLLRLSSRSLSALAMQGVRLRFLGDFGHAVRLA